MSDDSKKIERELHSSMKLLFGRCSAWSIVGGKATEHENIFSCSTNSVRGRNIYTGDKFAKTPFWRATSDRFWQYDDFAFDGLAAASYLIDAHRFKIWFNPRRCYDYMYQCAAYDSLDVPDSIAENPEKLKEYSEKKEKEWNDVISGANKSFDNKLNKFGWNRELSNMLVRCSEKKTWDFNSWIAWNNELVTTPYLAQNCESIFVHEMFHIIWNHLARTEERDHAQFNIATDYAINQSINFTEEFSVGLITRHNKKFFNRFIVSTIKYLMQTDEDVAKSLKTDYKINEKTDFNKLSEKMISDLYNSYMVDGSNAWHRVDKFAHKSADLYYRILMESCVIVSGEGLSGFDSHGKWNDNGQPGEGQTIEKDGKKYEKGASEGTEKCDKKSDGKDGDKPDFHSDHDKRRGKGGREEHRGFDSMEAAASRSEVKSTIKDSLERSGVNPDDPDEIEKALKATPGMDILGALILDWFKVKRKNWKQLLKKELVSFSNPQDIDYTMSRESRVLEGFFPGKKRERGLDVIFQVDTSGSINLKDWNDFVNQIEEIARSCDVKMMRCLQVHSVIACDELVNLRKVKNWRIKETGGTTMALGPEKLKREGNKKLLIIFTDGYTDVFFQKDYPFKIMIFLSRGNSHNTETFKERGFTVINQDEE